MALKILSLANTPALNHLGSGYVIHNFNKGLQDQGYEVDFFGPEHFEVLSCLAPRARQYRLALGMLRFVKKQLYQKEYDIIEFWGGESFMAIKYLAGLTNRRFKIVHHTNGPEPKYESISRALYPEKYRWYQFKRRRLMWPSFSLPDLVITVSLDDKKWLEERQLPKKGKVIAISPGLPDQFIGLPFTVDRPKRIGFCGTWLPKKGVAVMQAIIPNILRTYPDWRFTIIGQPDTFQAANYFPQDILSQIEVIPFIRDKTELIRQYQQLQIFFLPSIHESFGLVIPEAMACGCAVISSEVGFAHELENGQDAIVVSAYKERNFEQALRNLIDNRVQRLQIATSGYQKSQKLLWKNSIQKKSFFLNEII